MPPRYEDGRLAHWLGAAALLHAAGFAGAVLLDARHPATASSEVPSLSIDVAAEPDRAVAKAPEPPPEAPPRVMSAPAISALGVAAPRAQKTPAQRTVPAARDPNQDKNITESLVNALSAVATEASRILASDQGNGPPIASGNAASAYGMVAGDGTGTVAPYDPRARRTGRPGGTGASAPDPPDRSRGASVFMGYNGDCDFPAEADRDHVDHGWASLVVTVLPDGRAARVRLLEDSGHGFGRVAQACALRARYRPALDRTGAASQADTPAFKYRFTR
jgi:protein TonB